jgi:hypothetical protein
VFVIQGFIQRRVPMNMKIIAKKKKKGIFYDTLKCEIAFLSKKALTDLTGFQYRHLKENVMGENFRKIATRLLAAPCAIRFNNFQLYY